MHRRTVATLFAFMSTLGSASLAHAGLDLTFANLTESVNNTWSVDVQVDWTPPTPEPVFIAGFQIGLTLEMQDAVSLTQFEMYSNSEYTNIFAFSLSSYGLNLEPDDLAVSLFRLEFQWDASSKELPSIIFDGIYFSGFFGDRIPMNQESYLLTIPAPGSIALLAGAFVGVRRRRAG